MPSAVTYLVQSLKTNSLLCSCSSLTCYLPDTKWAKHSPHSRSKFEQIRLGSSDNSRYVESTFPEMSVTNAALLQTLEGQLRKAAKQNQTATLKIMAKDFVRTKRNIQRFHEMRTQVRQRLGACRVASSRHCMSWPANCLQLFHHNYCSYKAFPSRFKPCLPWRR